ncbi:uncharacterized protein LOC123315416 [Coccinella septempunctata]|uniref:uncharacterized protein LOC123315416 n=1 Tax=Coccinella septempunctata TaxID=41139 RepID=UPI001D098242|nr:uncharacterized protein LOC123315416 [Coccinella septempunctata]
MNMNKLFQDEHEKYFFGCSSSEVYYTLEISLQNCVRGLMEECKKALIEENVCKNRDLIDKEISDMESLYMTRCMCVLGDFKSVIENIFAIPENACIYPKSRRKNYSKDDIAVLRQDVIDLQEQFLREKMVVSHLKKEKGILDKIMPTFQSTKMLLDELNSNTISSNKDMINKVNQKLEDCSRKLDFEIEIDKYHELKEDLGL